MMAAEYLVNRVSHGHVAKSKVVQGSAHACDDGQDGQHASKNRSGGLRRGDIGDIVQVCENDLTASEPNGALPN